jgi:CBS-domain-containing membrane protein
MMIDSKFKENKGKYILQCIMATGVIAMSLFMLDVVFDVAIVASLGSTSFIVFAMPHKRGSSNRVIILGNTIGIIVGGICYWFGSNHINIPHAIIAAISVGLCLFLMVILQAEHPPAAGIALGFVLEGFNVYTILIVYFVLLILLIMRRVLKRWLIDLT